MKATIIDTHHCIEIDGTQLDIFITSSITQFKFT